MDLYYGQFGTSNLTVKELGLQLATLGRTSPPMPRFIIRTLTTSIFGQRLWTLLIKKTYIEICYFSPINSNFYKKKNLDTNCPYNGLENDIYSLRNEGNILLMGDFNARTSSNQAILRSNHSNPNPLWLDEYLTLASMYNRSSGSRGKIVQI